MEHWNGTTWSVVAGPLPPGGGNLAAVARIPNTAQVVAVGSQGGGLTLIERWNEHQWTLQPSPNGSGPDGFDGGELNAVRAISPTNIWAAGDFSTSFDGQNFFNQRLIEHWDGSKWALSPSANVTRNGAPIGTTLFGITARSATDIWAVGYGGGWPVGGNPKVMVQHWNGATWSLVTTPDLGPLGGSELDGVAHIPGTSQVWAVGSGPTGQPLIEARC